MRTLLLILLLPLFAAGQSTNGAQAVYYFNDTVTDVSGNTNTGTGKSISYVPGKRQHAVHFGGAGYVTTPKVSSLNCSGEMTIAVWIRPTTTAAGSRAIISDYNSSGNVSQWSLYQSGAKIVWTWSDAAGPALTSNLSLTANKWYYVVAVRSGSAGSWVATLYINGKYDNSKTSAANPQAQQGAAWGRAGGYAGAYFQGDMDDGVIEKSAWGYAKQNRKYMGFTNTLDQ